VIEKLDIHEGITVKALLDSGVTRIFMDKRIAARHGFKLQKLKRPIVVRNMDSIREHLGWCLVSIEGLFY